MAIWAGGWSFLVQRGEVAVGGVAAVLMTAALLGASAGAMSAMRLATLRGTADCASLVPLAAGAMPVPGLHPVTGPAARTVAATAMMSVTAMMTVTAGRVAARPLTGAHAARLLLLVSVTGAVTGARLDVAVTAAAPLTAEHAPAAELPEMQWPPPLPPQTPLPKFHLVQT